MIERALNGRRAILSTLATVIGKDGLAAYRSRRTWITAWLLSAVILWLCSLNLRLIDRDAAPMAAAVLWLTIMFVATITSEYLYASERSDGCWDYTLAAPLPAWMVFAAKMAVQLGLLLIVAVGLIGESLLLGTLPSIQDLPALGLAVVLGCLGFASAGALIGGIAMQFAHRSLALTLLVLALQVPVLLGVTSLTLLTCRENAAGIWPWVTLVALFDVLFLWAGLWLFDLIAED